VSSRHILKAKSITNYFLYQESLVHHCRHSSTRQPRSPPRLDRNKEPEAVQALEAFIEGYLDDRSNYLHGFDTNQIESLNGSACKRVNKERNFTVMYGPLFDAGIRDVLLSSRKSKSC